MSYENQSPQNSIVTTNMDPGQKYYVTYPLMAAQNVYGVMGIPEYDLMATISVENPLAQPYDPGKSYSHFFLFQSAAHSYRSFPHSRASARNMRYANAHTGPNPQAAVLEYDSLQTIMRANGHPRPNLTDAADVKQLEAEFNPQPPLLRRVFRGAANLLSNSVRVEYLYPSDYRSVAISAGETNPHMYRTAPNRKIHFEQINLKYLSSGTGIVILNASNSPNHEITYSAGIPD